MWARCPLWALTVVSIFIAGCLGDGAQPGVPPQVSQEEWGTEATRLVLALPGHSGDLAFSVDLRFDEERSCDQTDGGSGPARTAATPVIFYADARQDGELRMYTFAGFGDTARVHVGPVDARPAMDSLRALATPLGGSGFRATVVGYPFDGNWTLRILGDDVAPSDSLGGSGLFMSIECDGPFRWGNLRAGAAVVTANPSSFEGNGLNALGFATYDDGTRLVFDLPEGPIEGVLLNDGGFVESGSLTVAHPDGTEEWVFPGEPVVFFEGSGGTYELVLDRMSVHVLGGSSLFDIVLGSLRPVGSLAELRSA